MKKKTLLNALVVVGIVTILYFFVGHNFTIFYLSGKSKLLVAATQINERCNIEGSCPSDLEGWTAQRFRAGMLSNGNMRYIVSWGAFYSVYKIITCL